MKRKLFIVALALVVMGGLGRLPGVGAQTAPQQGSPWLRYNLSGSDLQAVDAVAADDAWAVGSDGLLAHWDGATWAAYDNSKLGSTIVYGVDMLTADQAWASASSGRIYHWDGEAWQQEPTNLTATLYDVSMVTATDGWAVGSSGNFARYDGNNWQQVLPGGTLTPTLWAVDMLATDNGWAVGGATDGSGTIAKIARWNGSVWQDVSPTLNRILYDVDMLNPNYGWAVGSGGTLLEWNGSTWTLRTAPSNAVTVRAVAVVSSTDAWAAGSTNISTNNLWHWDGTAWTAVSTPNGAPLHGLAMLGASDGLAVADRATVYRWNGTNWTLANTRWTTNGYYGLDFLSPTDGWAVGVLNASPPAYGLQHWDGAAWTEYVPPSFSPTMYDVGMVANDAVWAVGTIGYIFRWNGTAWSRDTSPATASLYSLSMISAADGWAVGGSGRIVRYQNGVWADYTSPTTTNLWSVDMVDANEGWAGGTLGLMLHYQNGNWTQISPNPAAYTIEGIHMLNAGEGWAVGYNGTILHYQNGTWTPQSSPTTANLLNVYMLNSNEGWAVGAAAGGSATLLHYQSGVWSSVANPTGRDLRDIHLFAGGGGWAAGTAPGPLLQMAGGPQQTPTASVTPSNTAISPSATATAQPSSTVTVAPSNTATLPSATTTSGPSSTPPPATASPTNTPLLPPPPTAPPTATATACVINFSDVQPSDYFYVPVQYLACRGVISGYSDGTFRPYADTTRAQMVKIVVLGMAVPMVTPTAPGGQTFTDVPSTQPFYQVIEAAAARGIVSGYNCGGPNEPCDGENRPYFRPNNNVTRGQLSKIVVVAAGWPLQNPVERTFEDVLPGTTFYEVVETAYCHGIISGYNCGGAGEPCGTGNRPYFRQSNNATRGQIAKIVYGALVGAQACQTR